MPEDPISVVVAAPPLHIGGTEQHIVHVLPALAARGFDISVVLLAGGGELERALRDAGIWVVGPSARHARPLRTIEMALALRREVRTRRARLLHAFLSEPYLAARAAVMMLGTEGPSLIYGRRSLAFYMQAHPFAARLERLAHGRATALVGNSAAVATELVAESGAPEKVHIIHNGIPLGAPPDAAERLAARQLFGIEPSALVLTMVSNFHPYKGHANLLRALGPIARALPAGWRLLLPGRDGGALAGIRAEAEALGLSAHLVLPGPLPNSRATYAAADIGLIVSQTEGFSNSLLEGMAAARPMIATAVGGNVEAIVDGIDGLLVPFGDAAALSAAIEALARDEGRRSELGAAARATAERRFSLNACVDAYARLWRELATTDGR